jgi:hypothetical protein
VFDQGDSGIVSGKKEASYTTVQTTVYRLEVKKAQALYSP